MERMIQKYEKDPDDSIPFYYGGMGNIKFVLDKNFILLYQVFMRWHGS
jgi:hypothetical protein